VHKCVCVCVCVYSWEKEFRDRIDIRKETIAVNQSRREEEGLKMRRMGRILASATGLCYWSVFKGRTNFSLVMVKAGLILGDLVWGQNTKQLTKTAWGECSRPSSLAVQPSPLVWPDAPASTQQEGCQFRSSGTPPCLLGQIFWWLCLRSFINSHRQLLTHDGST
jgi:hypothetical protein